VKYRTKTMNYKPSCLNAASQSQINQFLELEGNMNLNDRNIVETLERKNDLESFIYSWRSNISSQYADYVEQDKVPAFLKQLEVEEAWLYDDGENAQKSEYVNRINAL